MKPAAMRHEGSSGDRPQQAPAGAAHLEQVQASIDFWLRCQFGALADTLRPWLAVDQRCKEGIVAAEDIGPLVSALLTCPHFAYHFDMHPRIPRDADYEVYVEPAGPKIGE